MKQSESISNLAEALIALQAELPVIPFDSVNPHYKSDYASLKAILGIVRPLLVKHNLAIIQLPSSPNPPLLEVSTITAAVPNAPSASTAFALAGLSTRLVHASGEWLEDEIHIPVEADQRRVAQIAGSTITYMRRYSISALLGIITDEDTDGEPAPVNGKSEPKPTAAQLKMLHTIGNGHYGKDWNDKRPMLVGVVTRHRTRSSKELTVKEFQTLVDGIQLEIDKENE